MEISDGANKKPFRGLGLLNKSQLKLASYIKQNKNVTLQGTKRFMDKSGEYYLKNIQLQNKKKDNLRKSLNKPLNLENCLNKKDINKIKRKASKIVTLLPENSLTPIPKKKDVKDNSLANIYGKKELDEAQRTAVFIRRMEYSTSMKRQIVEDKNLKEQAKKIALIQEWWKAMFKIIKIQKNFRGFLFRKKLMSNLEHQEKLLQFITEFDNIHSYHLYKQFMDNLKKKRDYENSKLMEKCEDFNEKLDNLEKLHNYKNFKNCFKKWKEDTKNKKKEALDNFINKIKDILLNNEKKDKENSLNKIKEKDKKEEKILNDKIKQFREKQAMKKFFNDLIKLHKMNKDTKNKESLKNNLIKWKNIKDDFNERKKIINKLKKYKQNEIKTKKEEELKKLVISSGTNSLEVLSDKQNIDNKESPKTNKIFISPQNEINFLMEPQKILLSKDNQSFSLITPETIKFNFGSPLQKSQKLDNHISNQLDNIIAFRNNKIKEKEENQKEEEEKPIIIKKNMNDLKTITKIKDNKNDLNNALNKLNEILQKAKEENDKGLKKEFLDKLKDGINIWKLAKQLEDHINKKYKQCLIEDLKEKKEDKNDDEEFKNIKVRKSLNLLQTYLNVLTVKNFLFTSKKNEDEIKEDNIDKNEKGEDKIPEEKFDENKIEILPRKSILFKMKKEEEQEPEKKISFSKKRIAYRRSPKKNKYLKKALDKSRKNSDLTDDNLLNKYTKKVLQDLIKVYKKGQDLSLKKYFDKWKNKENKENGKKEEEILKYKKKPRILYKSDIIEDDEKEIINEKDSFKPTYYLPKENLHKKILENPNIDESVHESIDSNNIEINNEKDKPQPIPYIKKYGKRFYKNKEYPNYNIDINPPEEYYNPQPKQLKTNKLSNHQYSDNSSEDSFLSGITLIQNKKEIKEPRNYTSQSFFIDKSKTNKESIPNGNSNITKNEIYKINQIPNMMKGDFENFIVHNPKILEKKNPRIQVTRSTCDLSNVININENNDINNNNKVLSNIVKNCDYDLYANQKSKCKKDKWYSMSIPLNQIKSNFAYKRINKNEMNEKNENDKMYCNYKFKAIKPYIYNNNEKNNYTLQEMNCSQYYRSPMRSIKRNKYDDKFQLNDTIIRIPGKQKRNIHQSLSPFNRNNRKFINTQEYNEFK